MRRFFKRLTLLFFVLGILLLAAFLFREPLLRRAADAWVVNERLTKADVIVVPGGGLETRPFAAARLYHQGLAPKILLMNPKPTATQDLGLIPAEAEIARQVLLKQEVKEADIAIAADWVTNTYEESIAVRNWAQTNHIKRLIIATDVFHTRRVRWLFGKELGAAGLQVEVAAVPVREYTLADWWKHELGVIAFQNEILKYAYYRLKY